jgi:hypothetical protein
VTWLWRSDTTGRPAIRAATQILRAVSADL